MPHCRDIYLKIERISGYSPVASDDAEPLLFRQYIAAEIARAASQVSEGPAVRTAT